MFAGSLTRNPITAIFCLTLTLLLAGCSGSKSSDMGSYSGAVYTVKRGDTLYRISRMTGTSVKDIARMNNIPAPYTLEVGQQLRVNGSSSSSAKKSTTSKGKTAKVTPSYAVPQSSWPPVGQRCWRWPTSGKVVLPYSTADGGNKGIDIAGTRGQPILATAPGRVVYAGSALRGYGNLIIIKHNDDYLSAYAHNDTMLVREQQEVKAGQKIATMGSTGTSSTRLHFEIRYKGKSVNPLQYLPQR